jgi:hypothetical protein
MLRSKRGFTVISFIVVMTVAGLFLTAVAVWVAQRTWRDNQRKTDLAQVVGMVERYSANHLGKYPKSKEADDPSSALSEQFQALKLRDPKTDKYYGFGSDFGPCDPGGDPAHLGTGYISYAKPGNNAPFKVRVCLEWGEYSIGD